MCVFLASCFIFFQLLISSLFLSPFMSILFFAFPADFLLSLLVLFFSLSFVFSIFLLSLSLKKVAGQPHISPADLFVFPVSHLNKKKAFVRIANSFVARRILPF